MNRIILVAYLMAYSVSLFGGEEPKTSPLGIKQEGLSSEMKSIELNMSKLIKALEKIEPEQARRLSEALNIARRANTAKAMAEATKLLNNMDLDPAEKELTSIIDNLNRMLTILIEDESRYDNLEKEIQILENWKNEINKIAKEEWNEKRESEKYLDPQSETDRLDKHIKELKDIKNKQSDLLKKTSDAIKKGDMNLDKFTKEQDKLKRQTDKVAKKIEQEVTHDNTEQKDNEPGEEAIKQASESQKKSADNLNKNKGKSATEEQKKAIQKLDSAINAMEKEKQRLNSIPKNNNEKMAENQDSTSDKTDKLEEEMKKHSQQQSEQNSQQGEQSEKSPGQKSIKQAQQSMEQASQQLRKDDKKSAAQEQKEAIKKLDEAQKEIQKKIDEKRKQQQDQLLDKLKTIFEEMLARQKTITKKTTELNKTKLEKKWTRTEQLSVLKASNDETNLSSIAGKALQMMEKDGTPTIFPIVTRELINDIDKTASLLKDSQIGSFTKHLQEQIEQTLKDLIGSLDEAQQNPPDSQGDQSQQNQQDQQGPQQKPPLVSDIAELKLLYAMQLRVNQRTKTLNGLLLDKSTNNSKTMSEERKSLTEKQAKIEAMTKKLIDKIEKNKSRQP